MAAPIAAMTTAETMPVDHWSDRIKKAGTAAVSSPSTSATNPTAGASAPRSRPSSRKNKNHSTAHSSQITPNAGSASTAKACQE